MWAITSGLLLILAFPPNGFWLASWFGLAAWAHTVCSASNWLVAARRGFVTGLLLSVALLDCIRTSGNPNEIGLLGPFGVFWILLLMGSAAAWGMISAVLHLVTKRGGFPMLLSLPLCITSGELFQGGLSWVSLKTSSGPASIATTQLECVYLVQVGAIAGTTGIVWMVGTAAAVILNTAKRFSRDPRETTHGHFTLIAGSLELLAAVLYGAWHCRELPAASIMTVAVVPQALDQPLAVFRDVITNGESKVSLVIWPELATVRTFSTVEPDELAAEFQRLANALGVPILLGCRRMDERHGLAVHNSVVLVTPQRGVVKTYDKMYLTPMLETDCLPTWMRPWIPLSTAAHLPTIPSSPGDAAGIFWLPNNSSQECSFGVGICHDACFSAWARDCLKSTPRPAFLVQCANESIDQAGCGQPRLLACVRLRAIESDRAVVRCVLGGISTAIDRCGRLQDGTPSRPWNIPFLAEVRCDDCPRSVYHWIGGDRGVAVGLTVIWLSVLVNDFVTGRLARRVGDGDSNTAGGAGSLQ